jgi:hypothetical protein
MDDGMFADDDELLEQLYSSYSRQTSSRTAAPKVRTKAPRSDRGRQHSKPAKQHRTTGANPTGASRDPLAFSEDHGTFFDEPYMEGTPAAAAAGTAGPEQQQQERLEALAADLERLYQQQQAYAAPRVAEASNSSERGEQQEQQWQGRRPALSLLYMQQQAAPAEGTLCTDCHERAANIRYVRGVLSDPQHIVIYADVMFDWPQVFHMRSSMWACAFVQHL